MLAEIIGLSLHVSGLDNGFLDVTPISQKTTEKDKIELYQNSNFCASKEAIRKVRDKPRMRGEYLEYMYPLRIYMQNI